MTRAEAEKAFDEMLADLVDLHQSAVDHKLDRTYLIRLAGQISGVRAAKRALLKRFDKE